MNEKIREKLKDIGSITLLEDLRYSVRHNDPMVLTYDPVKKLNFEIDCVSVIDELKVRLSR